MYDYVTYIKVMSYGSGRSAITGGILIVIDCTITDIIRRYSITDCMSSSLVKSCT